MEKNTSKETVSGKIMKETVVEKNSSPYITNSYCKNTPWKSGANNAYEVIKHVTWVGTADPVEHHTQK